MRIDSAHGSGYTADVTLDAQDLETMDDTQRVALLEMLVTGVLADGKVTPEEVTRTGSEGQLWLSAPPALDVGALRTALPDAYRVREALPGRYLVEGTIDPAVVAAAATWCAELGVLATEIRVDQRSLEDVFLELTGRELRG